MKVNNYFHYNTGVWKENTAVAVQILNEKAFDTRTVCEKASILRTFRHKNIVQLYAFCERDAGKDELHVRSFFSHETMFL